jgi:hypothetical protein
MIARHYGAPTTSLRDSLYGVMFNDALAQQLLGMTRAEVMVDGVHPTGAGFKIYGEIVAYSVRQTLAAVLGNAAAEPVALRAIAAAAADGTGLPMPVSPVAALQDTDVWCKEGSSFQAVASCGQPVRGSSCKWKTTDFNIYCPHDNCKMRGYLLKGGGQALQSLWTPACLKQRQPTAAAAAALRSLSAGTWQ